MKGPLHSPLRVVLVAVFALAVWSSAFEFSKSNASPGSEALTLSSSSKHDLSLGLRSTGPRLLESPDPEVLGLAIALEDAKGSSMNAFHRALERVKEKNEQARIVFYGASHVASDLFTGYIRDTLQAHYGDAGHGFVLPVRPWKHYSHRGVRIDSSDKRWESIRIRVNDSDIQNVGVAGVAVQSKRRGAYGRVTTSGNVSEVEVYYWKHPRGGRFAIQVDGKTVRTVSTRAKKRGAEYAKLSLSDEPHEIGIEVLGNGPVRIFGVSLERNEPGVIVDTLGINGSRARYQLLWSTRLFREHLKRRKPNLVVLAYGTNESGDSTPISLYEERLRKVVRRVKKFAPKASCLLIGPSDRPAKVADHVYEYRARTSEVIKIQHRVALELGCAFFDLVAFQGGPMSTIRWAAVEPSYMSEDHIHYTRRGYRRLGEVLLGALLEGVPDMPAIDVFKEERAEQDTAQNAEEKTQ